MIYSYDKFLATHDFNKSASERGGSPILCKGQVFKTVAIKDSLLGVANHHYLTFIDLRNNAQTLNFKINKECRTFSIVNEFSAFYGCGDGEVGLIDRRVTEKRIWSNSEYHKGNRIYDVCRVGDIVLTADTAGTVAGWQPLNKKA